MYKSLMRYIKRMNIYFSLICGKVTTFNVIENIL